MSSGLNLVQGAVNQTRPQIVYGQVSTTQPVPVSFSSPLYVVTPQWQTSYYQTFTEWPALHGTTLPAAGANVVMAYDSTGAQRVVWWDATTAFTGISPAGAAAGVLSGTYPNPGMASGAASTNVGTLGGDLSGTLPNPQLAPPRARTNTITGSATTLSSVTVTTASWSLQNGMVVSGNGIEVPTAGYYAMHAVLTGPNGSGTGYYQAQFSINGGTDFPTNTATTGIPTAASFPGVTVLDEAHMNANDVVTLVFVNGTSSTQALNGGVWVVRYTGQ